MKRLFVFLSLVLLSSAYAMDSSSGASSSSAFASMALADTRILKRIERFADRLYCIAEAGGDFDFEAALKEAGISDRFCARADKIFTSGFKEATPKSIKKAQDDVIADLSALIAGGASLEGCDESGTTPLIYATCRGYIGIVELLLTKGAKARAVDTKGFDALHHGMIHATPLHFLSFANFITAIAGVPCNIEECADLLIKNMKLAPAGVLAHKLKVEEYLKETSCIEDKTVVQKMADYIGACIQSLKASLRKLDDKLTL